jgi:hypothetical protein
MCYFLYLISLGLTAQPYLKGPLLLFLIHTHSLLQGFPGNSKPRLTDGVSPSSSLLLLLRLLLLLLDVVDGGGGRAVGTSSSFLPHPVLLSGHTKAYAILYLESTYVEVRTFMEGADARPFGFPKCLKVHIAKQKDHDQTTNSNLEEMAKKTFSFGEKRSGKLYFIISFHVV